MKRSIEYHYNQALRLAEKELVRRARKELTKNPNLKDFTIAMGTYFFTHKDGHILHNYKCRSVDYFIMKWDHALYLTGNPMCFTAKGKITRDW